MVDGTKEFQLTAEPVRRELLPGLWMDTYGYNGDMPGPTIEINQGDRVRIIVTNNLPEGTSMHWHGLEVPVEMDGVPHLVQSLIEPGKTFVYEFVVHQEGTFFTIRMWVCRKPWEWSDCSSYIQQPRTCPPSTETFARSLKSFNFGPIHPSLIRWRWSGTI